MKLRQPGDAGAKSDRRSARGSASNRALEDERLVSQTTRAPLGARFFCLAIEADQAAGAMMARDHMDRNKEQTQR